MKIGYFLSSKESGRDDLVAHAVPAKEASFNGLWISDHSHPSNDTQGHRPFVGRQSVRSLRPPVA